MLVEGSPPTLEGTEKPSVPLSGALKVSGETVLVEEVVVPEDCPPDGGLRAWLVVFGVRSRVRMRHFALTSALSVQIFCGLGAMTATVNAWGVSAIAALVVVTRWSDWNHP